MLEMVRNYTIFNNKKDILKNFDIVILTTEDSLLKFAFKLIAYSTVCHHHICLLDYLHALLCTYIKLREKGTFAHTALHT